MNRLLSLQQQRRCKNLSSKYCVNKARYIALNVVVNSSSSSRSGSYSSIIAPPPRTRLEREARRIVALDVEYAHILFEDSSKRLQVPAEICVVDWQGITLLHTLCDGLCEIPGAETSPWKFTGGVRPGEWRGTEPLPAVRNRLVALISDRPVVGHNLAKDLVALGIDGAVPLSLRRDTMRYECLQGPRGFGRSLAELAETRLGRQIQARARHDPWEDAVAALDLYLEYCHFDPALMCYDDLVEYYATEVLSTATPVEEVEEA